MGPADGAAVRAGCRRAAPPKRSVYRRLAAIQREVERVRRSSTRATCAGDARRGSPEVGFVTGQLVRVDLVTQTARVLNAGHPAPFRLREGKAQKIELTANSPFGAVEGASWSEP